MSGETPDAAPPVSRLARFHSLLDQLLDRALKDTANPSASASDVKNGLDLLKLARSSGYVDLRRMADQEARGVAPTTGPTSEDARGLPVFEDEGA